MEAGSKILRMLAIGIVPVLGLRVQWFNGVGAACGEHMCGFEVVDQW